MNPLKIGVIREGKNPPDKRVPLSPQQCKLAMETFPNLEIVVQPSPIRKFSDSEFKALGIKMEEDLSSCDILIGVKEVPVEMLIPSKTYLFFSHTFKLQPYNATLLKSVLEKKIRLIDYEVLRAKGQRLIGFGRYAGVVGCYNGFRTYGLKQGLFQLKPANQCDNRKEMEAELDKVILPSNAKFVLTGLGRVGHGAREIMSLLPIEEVSSEAFRTEEFDQPVFTHLETDDYNARVSDGGYDRSEFYADPSNYLSTFMSYAAKADMYIACHYWSEGSPFIFTREDMKKEDWRISVVADISCDINGPVASTLRPSNIADPIYGYDPTTEEETVFTAPTAIAVMAVDNLPCELPKDASEDFGGEFLKHIMPLLVNGDQDEILERASETTLDGELGAHFTYLADYVANAK
ncbi:MAG: saccharopine dehydrogenase (NAD+, L-lysine-forming) [Flavobacteriales bacterium]|jgi:saccharopine dehydrogenase (NAD+, L-lysine-forming)